MRAFGISVEFDRNMRLKENEEQVGFRWSTISRGLKSGSMTPRRCAGPDDPRKFRLAGP
jgi:hypothetical protein